MMRLARSALALALALSSLACGRLPPRAAPHRMVATRAARGEAASDSRPVTNMLAGEPRSVSGPPDYPGWVTRKASKISVETSAGVGVGRFVDDGTTLVGAQLRLGTRWAPY